MSKSNNLQKELKYIKVFKDLKQKILTYNLPPGTQLLGIRELMKHYDVSYVTINSALNELEKYNLIKRKQGQGIFVEAKEAWNLKDKVRKLVGLIVTDMNIPFFSRIIRVVESELVDLGYEVIVRNSDFSSVREKEIIQGFIKRGVKGIIMVPTFDEGDSDFLTKVDGTKIPIVYIIRRKHSYECNYIVPDDYAGTYKAINYLIDKGHKDIGYIAGDLIKGHDLRFKAYKNCMENNSLNINEDWIIYNNHFEINSGYEAFHRLKNSKELPSAIFCYTDSMAVGAIKACKEEGKNIPEDISFISCNNDEISNLIDPPITTLNVPIDNICKTAINNLNDFICNKEKYSQPIQLRVPMNLIKRNSVIDLNI